MKNITNGLMFTLAINVCSERNYCKVLFIVSFELKILPDAVESDPWKP